MNTVQSIRAFTFALFLILFSMLPTHASEIEDTGVMLAMELKSLSQSVAELTALLEKQSHKAQADDELRKLEIAIAYLNFRSRRIEMFEQDLQAVKKQRNRLSDTLELFQREEEHLEESFDQNQQEALQRAKEELRFRQQSFKERVSRLDEEIILLENRIMEMQSQIDSVESFVERNLVF